MPSTAGTGVFGDESVPPVGVAYFAGTFVRHPLALAAARAVLLHLKEHGPALQRELGARTTAFVEGMNASFREVGVPLELRHFSSFWRTFATADLAHQDLLFYMLRDRGVHIFEGFPCFFTTAHTEADFAHVARAYRESVLELVEGGFFPGREPDPRPQVLDASAPPVTGARLGRDPAGQPAWYVPHPTDAGRYVKYDPS